MKMKVPHAAFPLDLEIPKMGLKCFFQEQNKIKLSEAGAK